MAVMACTGCGLREAEYEVQASNPVTKVKLGETAHLCEDCMRKGYQMKQQFNNIINDIEHTKQYIEIAVNTTEENAEVKCDRYEMLSLHDRLDNAGIALADLRDEVIEALTPPEARVSSTNIECLTNDELIKACLEIWDRSDGIYPENSTSIMRVIYNLYQGTYSMRTIEQLVTREAVKRFKGLVKLLMTDHPTEFIDMRRRV